jgi:hypothetical protein
VLLLLVGGLVWVLYHKERQEYRRQQEFLSQLDLKHVELISVLNKQHIDDSQKHEQIIQAWRRDQENVLIDRERYFSIVVKVTTESAAAMQNMANAVREIRDMVHLLMKDKMT